MGLNILLRADLTEFQASLKLRLFIPPQLSNVPLAPGFAGVGPGGAGG